MKKYLFIIIGLFMGMAVAKAQSPYKIDTVTGSHLLDGSGNPVRNDKNWNVTILKLNSEFISNALTTGYPNNMNYWAYLPENMRAKNYDPSVTSFFQTHFSMVDGNDFINSPEDYPGPYSYSGYQSHFFNQTSGITSCVLRLEKVENFKGWYPVYPADAEYDNTKPDSWPGVSGYQKKIVPVEATNQYRYTEGMLQSNQWFKYGWFEIKCRIKTPLPIPNPANFNFTGIGYNFWLFGWKPNIYSEIDIFENDMSRGLMTSNTHINLQAPKYNVPGYYGNRSDPNLLGGLDCQGNKFYQDRHIDMFNFKTFSLEWLNNNITTYYNNDRVMQYRHKDNPDALPSSFSDMKIIVGFGANYFCKTAEPENKTLEKIDYEIDYIKVYRLICTDAVNVIQNANTIYDFNAYTYGVKNNIIFGGTNCQAKVTNGMNVSLRAKGSIELKEGFEVFPGGEFYAAICECTN